jgi:putative endonuclease
MSQHNEVGKIGEELARKYLEGKGYKIVEQNYRTRYAEIDLVATFRDGFFGKEKLVFVEVRTKVGERYGTPEDTINKKKLWKVLQNANSYAGFNKWQGMYYIDAVCIVLRSDLTVERLNHYENIIS